MSFPEVLKTRPDPNAFPQNMAVHSTRIDPVVFNDGVSGTNGSLRFNLDSNVGGILDQNSHLCLSLRIPNGHLAYYPAGIGIMSLVKNCRLYIGGVEISSTNSWNQYQTVESTASQGQSRKNYDTIKYGSNFYFQNNNDQASLPADARDTVGFGGEGYTEADKSAIGPQFTRTSLTNGDADTFQGSIPIGYLFKFMQDRQLPIFLMDEQVTIEIDLQDDLGNGQRYCDFEGWAVGSQLVLNDCYLLADYMIYPPDTMEAIADQQQSVGLRFDYRDVETNVSLVPNAGAVTDSTFVQLIGGVNQRIRNLKIVNQPVLDDTNTILGDYLSTGKYTQKSVNLKINNSNYFPDNDQTYPQLYANLVHCFAPLKNYIPRTVYEYSGGDAMHNLPPVGAQTYLTKDQQLEFGGNVSVMGIDFTDMENQPLMNGDVPLELNYYRSNAPGDLNNMTEYLHAFLEYDRAFLLGKNGVSISSAFIPADTPL